jgi:hypothetical protein
MEFGGDLGVAYVLWQQGVITSEHLVDTATQALVDGLDSPSLRELAGVRAADAPYDAPELAVRALEELGLKPSDEHRARQTLACGLARRVVHGEDDEFRGAAQLWRIFMTAERYPDYAAQLIGLEDEWEGSWGRTPDQLRAEIRTIAAHILDAWGDRMSSVHRLHSDARRWLMDEVARWAAVYAELYRTGEWQVSTGAGPWKYSDQALAVFPRYRIAEELIAEIERLRPSAFTTPEFLRSAISVAIGVAARAKVAERPAAQDEIEAFRLWLASANAAAMAGDLLPYRRTLSSNEAQLRRGQLHERWSIEDSWVPMTNQQVPEGTLILDSAIWEEPAAVDALRTSLRDEGVTVVVSLNETAPSFEVAVEWFEPGYGGSGEILAIPLSPWFVMYTSHEGTSALSKAPTSTGFGARSRISTDGSGAAGHRVPNPARTPRARLIVVGVVSNGLSIADPNDRGMLDVVGFDSSAPQVMADFAAGQMHPRLGRTVRTDKGLGPVRERVDQPLVEVLLQSLSCRRCTSETGMAWSPSTSTSTGWSRCARRRSTQDRPAQQADQQRSAAAVPA